MAEKKLVVGVMNMKGQKEGGAPYDFATVYILEPVEVAQSKTFSKAGHGLEPVEMRCAPEAVQAFAGLGLEKGPVLLELVTESRRAFGKYETTCVGVAPALQSVQPGSAKKAN